MIVLKKEPGKDPVLTDIDNTLEAFQKNVGGYIETVTLTEELVIVCNEEGRIQSLPYNCTVDKRRFLRNDPDSWNRRRRIYRRSYYDCKILFKAGTGKRQ